ncbi:MAG: hypothetical protein BWY78_01200 [Alphaproteobacteria bacterium ADurb.Bin438]|nr:MAG: hypothetical protein BWY78_01200 [Alphaproteobacteria bacterium ADurb.Bin438]
MSGAKFKDKAADKGVEDKKVSKKQEDISKKISEDDGILSEEEIFSDIKDDTRIDDLPEFETSGPDEKQVAINGDSVDEILINAGYKISKKIEFEESTIDFLAYSSELVLLVKYFDDDGQWLADEIPFRDEDPQWFSETSQKTSPVKEITNLCEKFEEKINGMFSVVPVLIITKANIMNAEEISKTWEELGVIVALSEDGGPSGILPEVGEAIPYADGEVDEDKMKEVEELL